MKRKQLKALPLPETLKSTKHVGGKEFTFWRICALYSSSIDQSTGEEILIIDLFNHLSGEFMRRFFFSADNWFSIDEEKSVSSGQLMGDHYWREYDFKPIKKTDALVIGEFFSENEKIEERKRSLYGPNAIDIAQCFCETIYEERKKRYRESTKKRTERELAELKEPPKGFYSWIDKTATAEWKALFVEPVTKKTAKTKTGYCACCGKKVEVKRVKLGERVRCPNCKTMCTTKSAAKYSNMGTQGFHKNVSYIEPLTDNRFCIREFDLRYSFTISKSKTGVFSAHSEFRTFEFGKWFMKFDISGKLVFEKGYKPSSDYRIGEWAKTKYCCVGASMIYPRGLNKLFRSAPGFNLWHFDYEKLVKAIHKIDPNYLYIESKKIRCLYNLFQNGFYRMTANVINSYAYATYKIIDEDHGALKKALGLGKEEIKAFSAMDIGFEELALYKEYRVSGKKVVIDDFVEYLKIKRRIGASGGFLDGVLKRSSLFKFNQYVNNQIAKSQINHIKSFAIDYCDYLKMAKKLNYDIKNQNVLFPKNFQKAHDTLSKIITEIEFKKNEIIAIKDQFTVYNQAYYYENKEFIVTPPTCHKDLIREGEKLKHCVADYAARVGKGQTIILFVRKKEEPDKPFYTLNIDPKDYHQIQCRGLQNCDTTKEVNQFLAEWRRKKIDPLKRSKGKCKKTA